MRIIALTNEREKIIAEPNYVFCYTNPTQKTKSMGVIGKTISQDASEFKRLSLQRLPD